MEALLLGLLLDPGRLADALLALGFLGLGHTGGLSHRLACVG